MTLPHGRHLRLTVRPDAPLQLLFTGHMDTVFPVDHAFQATRFTDDGKVINGPGTADMKGGIAVMLAALKAVEASGTASFGYDIVINSDEEVGSLASAALLAEAAHGKRAALTYEPAALPDGTLAGARPGSGNFDFTIHGRSAHAGRNPEDGRNALLAAADLALRLKAGMGPGLSVNPARIDGGSPNNVVPDLAVLRVNMRPSSTDDQARAQALIEREVAAVIAGHDVAIHVHGHFARPPKPISNAAEHLFGIVQAGWRRPWPDDRLESHGRRLRRQQYRGLRSPGDRHDGRARRQNSFNGGISDRREPGRACGPVRADHPPACRGEAR